MKPAMISLCDRTGVMAMPWAQAGYECYCVDVAHSIRSARQADGIRYVWGDVRSWVPPAGIEIAFVAAFPPCTHVAVSGARDFQTKRGVMLRDALETFEACRLVASWSGAPYMIENPVGVLSSLPHIGRPDHYFHPWQYAGWFADDNYTKKTCLWTGNGFVMPPPFPGPYLGPPDDRIHKATPSDDRADVRSATPLGFAIAVFSANNSYRTSVAA